MIEYGIGFGRFGPSVMRLDLSKLKSGVQHLDRRYDPDAFGLEGEEFRLIAPVHLVADVTRDGQKVRVVGSLTTTIECDCGRCLDPFAVPVRASIDLLYFPEPDGEPESDRETSPDDIGVAHFKDDVIDLGEMMREQLFLALPMKPLCKDDCAGLCAICGINKNRGTCGCTSEWVDPRLEPLKHLTRGN